MIWLEIRNYLKPTNLEEAYETLLISKNNKLIAGGAWLKLSLKKAETLISLDGLGLDTIEEKKGFIEIGSMVTLRTVETNSLVKDVHDGILSQAIAKVMGMNIRNQATLGGSVMGRFAFSDILPALLVLDTLLVFHKSGGMSLEDFLKNPRMDKDILVKIKIRKESGQGFFKKVARTALDFSIVNIAITRNGKNFKVAVGSRPQVAQLAIGAMAYLNSAKELTEDTILEASRIAVNELSFSRNNRSSKEYREEVARVYVKRGLKKVISDES